VSKEISHKPSFPHPARVTRPARTRAKVFRRHHPKLLAFFAFFAPLTPQMGVKERFWNALETKEGGELWTNCG
jgi:hypothetical protein